MLLTSGVSDYSFLFCCCCCCHILITNEVKVIQSCLTLWDSMDYIVHGILQAGILEWVAFPFPRGSHNPGIKLRSPTLQADFFLPAEPPRKPKNTGVGSLSILQGIFLTQESNWNLLLSRQILYQLSHQGSPRIREWVGYPFFRGSSWPRNQIEVFGIAGGFFTVWAYTVHSHIHTLPL